MKFGHVAFLVVVMVCAIIAPAGAADLVLTFEQPTYVVADIVGQDEWEGVNGAMDVWADMPLSGLQSITLTGYPNRVTRSISSATFNNSTEISWLQRINHAGGLISIGTMDNPYTSNAVCIFSNEGYVNALSGGGWTTVSTYSVGDILSIKINLDFTSFRQNVTVVNQTNPGASAVSGWIAFGDNWAGATAFGGKIFLAGQHVAAGTDSMIDDLMIRTVPEPGSIVCLGACLMSFAGLVVRRRK